MTVQNPGNCTVISCKQTPRQAQPAMNVKPAEVAGQLPQRSGLCSMARRGQASGAHKATTRPYKNELVTYLKQEGLSLIKCSAVTKQALLGLDAKQNPRLVGGKSTAGTQAHKGQTDPLLCVNTSTDLKTQPLVIPFSGPSALQGQNVNCHGKAMRKLGSRGSC